MPVGFNYSNLFSHHLINYWRYSQAHQSNLFHSFDFSYKKNTKYEYFKHRARYVNQFTGVKGEVWVMGDTKEIVHNHRGSLQQRHLSPDLSQPRLGKYALVDLPSPVFPFTGNSTNLFLIALLKVFFLFCNILVFLLRLCFVYLGILSVKNNLFQISVFTCMQWSKSDEH